MTPENPSERRVYVRMKRNFMLSYLHKTNLSQKMEITQLKNISTGGMCFVTTQKIESSTELTIELTTPYLANTTLLQGTVKDSHEKAKGILYETRLEFGDLNSKDKMVLTQLIEFFMSEDKARNE